MSETEIRPRRPAPREDAPQLAAPAAEGVSVTPPDLSHYATGDDQRFLFPRDLQPPDIGGGAFLCDRITIIFPVFLPRGTKPRIGMMWMVDPDGHMESFRHRRLLAVGSWLEKLCIEVHDCGTADPALTRAAVMAEAHRKGLDLAWFRLDASPGKFFQGWNVFGSSDVLWLAEQLVAAGMEAVGLGAGSGAYAMPRRGYFTRLDATWNFDMRNATDARALIHEVGRRAAIVHRRVSGYEGTVLFPARAVSLSVYHKGPEMRAHPQRSIPDLLELADRLVRFEVVSRSERLDALGFRRVATWTYENSHKRLFDLWWSFVKKVELSKVDTVDCSLISGGAARSYAVWKSGMQVQAFVHRATAFRHRREVLVAGGPDILKERPAHEVVQFRRTLNLAPAVVPGEFGALLFRRAA